MRKTLLPTPPKPSGKYALAAMSGAFIVGVAVLVTIFASGSPTAFEAENGVLSACAHTVNDSSASNGQAVTFAGCKVVSADDPTNLDATGRTIPDTAYVIPGDAVFMAVAGNDRNAGTKAAPVQTLNQAISLVPAGGTIVLRAGTYRDWYSTSGSYAIVAKAFTIQPYPHEQAWFDGSDLVDGWTSDGAGHWYKDWNTPQFCAGAYYDFPYTQQAESLTDSQKKFSEISTDNLTGTSGRTYASSSGPCAHFDTYWSQNLVNGKPVATAAGDPQMVFKDGAPLSEVTSLSAVGSNGFFYEENLAAKTGRLYISFDPSGHTLEASARPDAFILGANSGSYTIRGLGFRRYASGSYEGLTSGAVYIGGHGGGAVIENDVFTSNAGGGLSFAAPSGATVNRSVFVANGHNGMGVNGHGTNWSQAIQDNTLIQNSVFSGNNTELFDYNSYLSTAAGGIKMAHMNGYTFRNNIVKDNLGISTGVWCDTNCTGGIMINNLVQNNYIGYHYEQDNAGIIASNVFSDNRSFGLDVGANGAEIYNNTFINNTTMGLRVYDDSRSGSIGVTTGRIAVGNNLAVGASTNLVYFGGSASGAGSSPTNPASWLTALDYNSYWRTSNSTLYREYYGSDNQYGTLANFISALPGLGFSSGFEAHSTDVISSTDPFFVDKTNGDYAVRASSTAYHSGGALPADVAAALNISASAGQTRGAVRWPGTQ
jgi:hypothetical protein